MKYNDNGEYKEIVVKSLDTLPVGTEVDFDGNEVPSGWEQINEWESVTYTDYISFENIVSTINSVSAIKKGNVVYIYYDIIATLGIGLTKIASISSNLKIGSWGSARFYDSNANNKPATLQAINGNLNIYTTEAGTRSAGGIMLFLA